MGKKPQTQIGKRAIRAIFEDARDALEEETRQIGAPDPNLARFDARFPDQPIKPGKWAGFPDNGMPPYCPFKVVGRDVDGLVYCVTATGHLRAITRFDDVALADLAAPLTNDLLHAWPAWSKAKQEMDDATGEMVMVAPKVVRLETKMAARAIINEAARLPDFDPKHQHRGRGGWRDGQDNFIWHSGRWLWRTDGGRIQRGEPALHDGFLYTRQQPTIEPWRAVVGAAESPAQRILADLQTWKWARPYLDPILMLGWIATAMLGGALRARPIIFTTGGAGVGKSTLHELVRHTLAGAVMSTVDTSAAGIYQQIKQDSLPIMVDELESKASSSRAQSVIELARVAYTGGEIFRGGQDHEGTSFTMRSSFFFSAINPPPMQTQDKTRMAVMNLSRLDQIDGVGRKISVSRDEDGRMILRQVMDGWGRFNNELLPFYWDILQEQGLDSRAIDTFGTLLAAADLLVGKERLEEAGLPVADMSALGDLIGAATAMERAERVDNWHACLSHLLQSTIEAWRGGEKLTVGGVVEQYKLGEMDATYARERLAAANLSLKTPRETKEWYLAVPKDGPMLKKIFAGEIWHEGVWWDALLQAPEEIVVRNRGNLQKMKINGDTKHCLLVDMREFSRFAGEEEG